MFAQVAALLVGAFFCFPTNKNRPFQRLDRLPHVPGVAGFQFIPAVWAFRHFTFQDEPLCILEFPVGSMPGLFCHLLASCLKKIVHNCTRLIVYYQDSKGYKIYFLT
jgi:hypothetical protein